MSINVLSYASDPHGLFLPSYWNEVKLASDEFFSVLRQCPKLQLQNGDIFGIGGALTSAWNAFSSVIMTGANAIKAFATGLYSKGIKPLYNQIIKPAYLNIVKPTALYVKKIAAKAGKQLINAAGAVWDQTKKLAASAGAGVKKLMKNEKIASQVISGVGSVVKAIVDRKSAKKAEKAALKQQQREFDQMIQAQNAYQEHLNNQTGMNISPYTTQFPTPYDEEASSAASAYSAPGSAGGSSSSAEALLFDFTVDPDEYVDQAVLREESAEPLRSQFVTSDNYESYDDDEEDDADDDKDGSNAESSAGWLPADTFDSCMEVDLCSQQSLM